VAVPTDVNRSTSQKRNLHERWIQFKPHQMGMQMPYRLDLKALEENVVWPTPAVPMAGFQGSGPQPTYQYLHNTRQRRLQGVVKGKRAIHIARNYMGLKRNFTGHQFRARGYFASGIGCDEKVVR
jgi:hypothetical protein